GAHIAEILKSIEAGERNRVAALSNLEIPDDVGAVSLTDHESIASATAGKHVAPTAAVDQIAVVVAGDDVGEVVAARRRWLPAEQCQILDVGRRGERIAMHAISGDRVDTGIGVLDHRVAMVP